MPICQHFAAVQQILGKEPGGRKAVLCVLCWGTTRRSVQAAGAWAEPAALAGTEDF